MVDLLLYIIIASAGIVIAVISIINLIQVVKNLKQQYGELKMARKIKLDSKTVAKAFLSVARKDITSAEIVEAVKAVGHDISATSVRSLLAHRTMNH